MPEARKHYIEKQINKLSVNDGMVCLAGIPIIVNDSLLIIDDGTANINVFLPDSFIEKQSKFIRAFGKVLEIDGKLALQADFIQDLTGIDIALYKKVKQLIDKSAT